MDTKSHTDFIWCLNVFLSEQSSLQCAPRRARIAALQQQHHAGGRLLGKVRLRGDWLLPVWISSGVGACTEEDCGALVRWWGSFSLFLCTLCFSLLLVCYVPHVSSNAVNLKTNKKRLFWSLFFCKISRKLFVVSDVSSSVGCMSPAGVRGQRSCFWSQSLKQFWLQYLRHHVRKTWLETHTWLHCVSFGL